MKKQKHAALFDDDADAPHVSGADDLHVNESFAKRFEHNARRAELHRLKEKHPEQYARLQAHAALRDDDDEQEEESTSEEEDDGFIAEETEAQILATLKKLRSKDPEIYDPSKRFFKDDDARDGDEAPAKAKKAKPMLLKDVLFQQAAEPESDDDDGLLQRVQDEDGDEGQGDGPTRELLEQVFDPSDEKDCFLKDYIASKAWMRGDDEDLLGGADDGPDLEEDAAFEEQAEAYEYHYNFRYEEPNSAKLVTHPRNVTSARLPDTRRAEQRARKAARKEAEETQRREEVKRLKNLKRQQIESRLAAIQEVAGRPTADAEAMDGELLDQLLQGDFDPAQYDELMARAFGQDYYEAEVEEDEEALAALATDDEQEADNGHDADKAVQGSSDGAGGSWAAPDDEDGPLTFKALRARLREAGQVGREDVARTRAEMQQLLEEYYKLDYEDHVGGVYTRFRYKHVPANNFGLDATDILGLEDRQLNQIVSLKKLAPYREDADLIQPNHKMLRKLVGKKRPAAEPASIEGNAPPDEELIEAQAGGGDGTDRHAGKPAKGPVKGPVKEHSAAAVGTKRKKVEKEGAVKAEAPGDGVALRAKKKKNNAASKAPVDPEQARRESFMKPGAGGWRAAHKASVPAKRSAAVNGKGGDKQPVKQDTPAQQPKAPRIDDGFSRNQRKNFKKRQARRLKHVSQNAAA